MSRPVLLCSNDKGLARDLQRTVTALDAARTPAEIPVARNGADGLRLACALEEPLVIVDVWLDEATDLLRAMREEAPGAMRLAVASYWVEPLRYAMQAAGAVELLDTPFDTDRLRELLGVAALEQSRPKGRLLCFLGAQSGNGASTICLHLGHLLANRSGRKALLVELDFHSGALACRLGVEPKQTLADLSGLQEREARVRWREAVTRWRKLDVLLGPPSSNLMSSRGLPPVQLVLEAALRGYDEVLADLPCSMNASVRDVVARAERVYLTATSEVSSLHLASRRFQELRAAGVPESKVFLVLNRVAEGRVLDEDDVRRIVGIGVKYRLRNDYKSVSEAEGKSDVLAVDSALGKGLQEMADDLTGRKRSASQMVQESLQWFFRGGGRG